MIFKNRKCEICTDTTNTIELECGHEMCKSCGAQWFRKSTKCPFCTLELSPGSIKSDFDTEQTTTQLAEYTADFDIRGYVSITPDEAVSRFMNLELFLTNLFNGPRMFAADGLNGLIANERYIPPIIPISIDPSNIPARTIRPTPDSVMNDELLQIGGREADPGTQSEAQDFNPWTRVRSNARRELPIVAIQYSNTPIEIEFDGSYGLQPLPTIRPPPLQLEYTTLPDRNRGPARRSNRRRVSQHTAE